MSGAGAGSGAGSGSGALSGGAGPGSAAQSGSGAGAAGDPAGDLLGELTDELTALGAVSDSFGVPTVDVPAEGWLSAHEQARGRLGLTFFDWLSAYDDGDRGFAVLTHLWSVPARRGALLRTRVDRQDPRLPTLTGVFRGANWHERECYEMFGIAFDGHPLLVPLLLPDGFEGHPLRKDFVLAARVAKSWPGAKEPGESDAQGAPSRRKMAPPGVPEPEEWGSDWR